MRYNSQDELTRRQFMLENARNYLGVSLLPMLGSSIASEAFAQSASQNKNPAKSVIFLNMSGGMSHLDTFDLKLNNKEVSGPIEGLKTPIDGYSVSQYLPHTAKVMDRFTVINSMHSKIGAHEQGQYLVHKSYVPRGTIVHPSVGAWVSKLAGRSNPTLPPYIAISSSAKSTGGGWMGANYSAAMVGDPAKGLEDVTRPHSVTEEDFHRRLKLADMINQKFHNDHGSAEVKSYHKVFEEAAKVMESEDLAAFDLSKEPASVKNLYGQSKFGQGCLLARRLVEADVRFIEVGLGGWDTHYDNFTGVEQRCSELDQPLAALIQDLESKGLLDSTLVVLATEFGRTPQIQSQYREGRGHHPSAFTYLVAGGGTKKGFVYGASDERGQKAVVDPVSIYDFNSTIAYALGIDHEEVHYSPSKRPFRMAGPDKEKGAPITSIFA